MVCCCKAEKTGITRPKQISKIRYHHSRYGVDPHMLRSVTMHSRSLPEARLTQRSILARVGVLSHAWLPGIQTNLRANITSDISTILSQGAPFFRIGFIRKGISLLYHASVTLVNIAIRHNKSKCSRCVLKGECTK